MLGCQKAYANNSIRIFSRARNLMGHFILSWPPPRRHFVFHAFFRLAWCHDCFFGLGDLCPAAYDHHHAGCLCFCDSEVLLYRLVSLYHRHRFIHGLDDYMAIFISFSYTLKPQLDTSNAPEPAASAPFAGAFARFGACVLRAVPLDVRRNL